MGNPYYPTKEKWVDLTPEEIWGDKFPSDLATSIEQLFLPKSSSWAQCKCLYCQWANSCCDNRSNYGKGTNNPATFGPTSISWVRRYTTNRTTLICKYLNEVWINTSTVPYHNWEKETLVKDEENA